MPGQPLPGLKSSAPYGGSARFGSTQSDPLRLRPDVAAGGVRSTSPRVVALPECRCYNAALSAGWAL